jgi:ketosteroid isomerase-like protein
MDDELAGPSARDVVADAFDAFARRDWSRLLALYHEDAVVQVVSAGNVPLTPKAFVALADERDTDGVLSYQLASIDALGDDACIARGRIRHRMENGVLADRAYFWLFVVRDDRIWRAAAFASEREAKAALAETGPDLGLSARGS